ncbi:carboxyltransferase domain-containing protein [Alphaproteobacteria bacterium]|nr:carboxyltransferase domain-containing protein [Alphaproteobacteria bacterium]
MFFKGINHYGDLGLMLDFGADSSQQISQEVNTVYALLQDLNLAPLNIVPSFNKIVMSFQNIKDRDHTQDVLEHHLAKANLSNTEKAGKIWTIPACYEDSYALDRELIQTTHGISNEELISKHTGVAYYTYYIGFMPGFPYLGDLDPSLITPRLATPRIQIPARSIGIAKEHTCIYPKVSPGGWNIIGQVPFDIFSLEHSRTSLFLPGDTVQFQSISEKEFIQMQSKHLGFDEILKEFSQ